MSRKKMFNQLCHTLVKAHIYTCELGTMAGWTMLGLVWSGLLNLVLTTDWE